MGVHPKDVTDPLEPPVSDLTHHVKRLCLCLFACLFMGDFVGDPEHQSAVGAVEHLTRVGVQTSGLRSIGEVGLHTQHPTYIYGASVSSVHIPIPRILTDVDVTVAILTLTSDS